MNHAIILFDGVCNLCNRSVQRIIKADPPGYFQFAALQSAVARDLLAAHGAARLQETQDSLVLIEQGHVYTASAAVLRIARKLRWPYPLLSVLKVIPAFLMDKLYQFIARNRYRWFGRRASCMLPDAGLQHRFL